jgi:hypothetical protein
MSQIQRRIHFHILGEVQMSISGLDPWVFWLLAVIGMAFGAVELAQAFVRLTWRSKVTALLAIGAVVPVCISAYVNVPALVEKIDPSAWITAGMCVVGLYCMAVGHEVGHAIKWLKNHLHKTAATPAVVVQPAATAQPAPAVGPPARTGVPLRRRG